MHEGMMALSIAMVAVIGSFLVIFGIVFISIRARNQKNEMMHKERMLALEKGVPVPPDYLDTMPRRRPYARGLVFTAVGLGLMVFGMINAQEDGDWDLVGVGVVFLFVGIALLIADRITTKKSNGLESGSYSGVEGPRPIEGSRS